MTDAFSLPIVPRYAEVDQQGVVFHGHYLTWFDEASTAYFDHLGLPIAEFDQWGVDVQTVHAEVDYLAPLRWRDEVRVAIRCESTGRTSFTLGFEVLRRDADGHRGADRPAAATSTSSSRRGTGRRGSCPPRCGRRSLPLRVKGATRPMAVPSPHEPRPRPPPRPR